MNPLNPEDMHDLKQLIEFLKQNQVAEFELDRGDLKVRLKFEEPQVWPAGLSDLAKLVDRVQAQAKQAGSAAPAAIADSTESRVDPDAGLHIVKSPIVGTFFGSPSPGTAPFISPGDRVEKGQVVGIVEAMKLMNEIESDAAGELLKCFVTDGQPVEYGQPLFSVRLE
jgi:acetyl-CoA carboxylase biotin carboxyl carrier protein